MPIIFFSWLVQVSPSVPSSFFEWGAVQLEHRAVFGVDYRPDAEIPLFFLAVFVGVGSDDRGDLIHDFAHSASSFFTFSSTSARNLMISASIAAMKLSSLSILATNICILSGILGS